MKKIFIIVGALIFTIGAVAQDSKFSTNFSYPITVGDNFVDKYSGVIDAGLQYRFVKVGQINIGLSGNFTYLRQTFSEDDFDPEAKANAIFLEPRVFAEIELNRLRPQLSMGYTYVSFTYKNGIQDLGISDENYNGFNVNLGLTYEITNRFFAIAQYEFIKINNDVGDPIKYNTDFGLVKFGLGLRF